MPLVEEKLALAYSSAVAIGQLGELQFDPPAINTYPLSRRVLVAEARGTFKVPAALKVPAPGSYSSALAG
jgi:hypothetical protein